MRRLVFEENSWEDYEELRLRDKKQHKKLCDILKEMRRGDDPTQGLGKPRPLRYELSERYSRRLSAFNFTRDIYALSFPLSRESM
jgi:toxin YoeB